MNNEPVAWMDEDENVVFEKCKVYPIPLYTHPANAWQGLTAEEIATIPNDEFRLQKVEKILKERNSNPANTLTISDKDILKIVHDKFTKFGFEADYIVEDTELIDFANAILRKAQEI